MRLTAVQGIGRWTAEMFPDVPRAARLTCSPVADIGRAAGIAVHYQRRRAPVPRLELREFAALWSAVAQRRDVVSVALARPYPRRY